MVQSLASTGFFLSTPFAGCYLCDTFGCIAECVTAISGWPYLFLEVMMVPWHPAVTVPVVCSFLQYGKFRPEGDQFVVVLLLLLCQLL